MKIRVQLKFALTAISLVTAFGCGGGGGSQQQPPPQPTTKIIGMAAKGPIIAGKVEVFEIGRDGNEIAPPALGSYLTGIDGAFDIDIGSYQGAIMLKVTGGSYTDEVSKKTVTLTTPLRALYANAKTGTNSVMITPLTDLAYRRAKGEAGNTPLTHISIDAANTRIASIFGMADIISTRPLMTATADDDQKKYAVVLGAFSQFVNDNKNTLPLDQALSEQLRVLGSDIVLNNGNFSPANTALINAAIVKYNQAIQPPPVTPPVEPPPVTPPVTPPVEPPPVIPPVQPPPVIPPITPIPTVALLKLSSSGGNGQIGGINITFTLPEGVTLKADSTGLTLAGVVAASGVASGNNVFTVANYTPSDGTTPGKVVISLNNPTGYGSGEFITVSFDITGAPPLLASFIQSGLNATNTSGQALGGFLTVTGALELR